MRVLAALGGNALIRAEAEIQRENIVIAASTLAAIARDHELVVTPTGSCSRASGISCSSTSRWRPRS